MPDQQNNKWRRPVSRVAAAGGPRWSIAQSVRGALQNAPIQLIEQPLRGPDGKVPAEVADADILISGGAAIDDAVLDQLRNVRFLLRPYVGYDDIDVDAATAQGILVANVPDTFVEHGSQDVLRDQLNLSAAGIVRTVRARFPELFARQQPALAG